MVLVEFIVNSDSTGHIVFIPSSMIFFRMTSSSNSSISVYCTTSIAQMTPQTLLSILTIPASYVNPTTHHRKKICVTCFSN